MEKNSRIYIAGHKGLVGSAILKNLETKGYKHFITRTHKELDLKDSQAVAAFFQKEQPEYVFLAAAKVGGIVANNTYRADFIYENLMIQNNIIHQCYLNGVKKLMFLGSTCIYPKNSPQPMKEDYLLTDVLEYTNEPYSIAKIAGIKMCESYNLQYGTNYISVMPTNLYGPNDNFDLAKSHVLPALIRKMHLGKALENSHWELIYHDLNKMPIEGVCGSSSKEDILTILDKYGIRRTRNKVLLEVWGSGNSMREFLWSEDMADACVFLMENRDFVDCCPNGNDIRNTHINVGTGIDISIKDLTILIKNIIGFSGDFYFNTKKPEGTMKKLTDTSKLQALGWKHTISIDEGIKKMYTLYSE